MFVLHHGHVRLSRISPVNNVSALRQWKWVGVESHPPTFFLSVRRHFGCVRVQSPLNKPLNYVFLTNDLSINHLMWFESAQEGWAHLPISANVLNKHSGSGSQELLLLVFLEVIVEAWQAVVLAAWWWNQGWHRKTVLLVKGFFDCSPT